MKQPQAISEKTALLFMADLKKRFPITYIKLEVYNVAGLIAKFGFARLVEREYVPSQVLVDCCAKIAKYVKEEIK